LPQWLSENEPLDYHAAEFGRSGQPVTHAAAASPALPAVAASGTTTSQPAVQGAETGRSMETPERPTGQPRGDGQPPVAPDIDQLARQVYAALKRRLEADARRERMFRG
jgi:hypothetical protein